MRNEGALRRTKELFALYVLQLKRFGVTQKIFENETPKSIPNQSRVLFDWILKFKEVLDKSTFLMNLGVAPGATEGDNRCLDVLDMHVQDIEASKGAPRGAI